MSRSNSRTGSWAPALTVVGPLLAIVLVAQTIESFGLNEFRPPERLSQAANADEAARVTTLASELIRWSALFFATLLAFLTGILIAIRALYLRWASWKGRPISIIIFLTLGIGLAGAVVDWRGDWRWGGAIEEFVQTSGGYERLRNASGWIFGAATVSTLFVLSVATLRKRSDVAHRRDVRAIRQLLWSVSLALALGVAQVSALFRLALARKFEVSGELSRILVPQHVVSIENAVTLGAGLLFTVICAVAFLPTFWSLERERHELLDELGLDQAKSAERERLGGSVWSGLSEVTAVLAPLASGIMLTSF